jgi:hypothetical protein
MFSKWLDPLSRPTIVIVLGSLSGLLFALASLLFPTSIGPAQPPLLTGLIAAAGTMLLLGMVTLISDAFVWVSGDEDEESSEEE